MVQESLRLRPQDSSVRWSSLLSTLSLFTLESVENTRVLCFVLPLLSLHPALSQDCTVGEKGVNPHTLTVRNHKSWCLLVQDAGCVLKGKAPCTLGSRSCHGSLPQRGKQASKGRKRAVPCDLPQDPSSDRGPCLVS